MSCRLQHRMRIVFATLCLGMCGLTLAQAPTWSQRPEAINFEPWRLVRKTEFLTEYDQSFPSALPSGIKENDEVRLKVFVPTDVISPPRVVLILHYWGATHLMLEQGMAEKMAERGIASVIMTLPYHLSRTPPGSRSGELAIRPDADSMIAMMRQSASDVERTLDWVASRPEFGRGPVGLVGTSLGALIAALARGIDSRIGPSAFLLGGVDLAGIVWHSSRVVAHRDILRRAGFTEDTLRERLEPIEPGSFLHADDRPSLVVGARFDTVIPRKSTERLIDALGNAEVVWIDTGHYGGALIERRLVNMVVRFMDSSFRGSKFDAPPKLYAPTIRLGLQYNPESFLQIAAGLDVWRSDREGKGFGAVLLTPRGLQGYLGLKINRDVSVGFSILPKRTTFGAFWSVVL